MSKSMNKVSVALKENLTSFLSQAEADTVMNAWNSWASSKKKKKKDPSAPKKAKSSYIFFCMDKRSALKSQDESLSANQLTTKLGQMWKTLSDKDKKKYEEMAKKDKDRYDSEMSTYTPVVNEEEPVKAGRKQKKERTGPKRPMSAYLYFCKDEREVLKKEQPNLKANEVTTQLGARWKALSEERKKAYEAKHVTDKARYEAEKGSPVAEKKTKTKEEKKEAVKETKKTEKKTKVKEEKKEVVKESKKKPEQELGYKAFLSDKKDELESENPDWGTRKITSELNKMWRELSDDERQAYELEEGGSDDEVGELEDE